MKAFSIKTSITALATAATLLTSGIAPTVSAAHAESIFVPGLSGKLQPKKPNPCLASPALCGPGIKVTPPAPPPPPPPGPSASSGVNAGGVAAMVVGGIIAGAAIANATRPKDVYVEPVGNSNAHSAWCHDRYKSYRDWDNSWKPYHGPRKQCISPYY